MSYKDIAFKIIKDSINSVVFIDEKAKDFYSFDPINPAINEEQLSFDLYKNFKEKGISLTVHKFDQSDVNDDKIKNFLFKDRDLILLDWELNDVGGEEFSLKLLSDIVQTSSINFCCIYTATSKFDLISKQIDKFFSGYTEAQFQLLNDDYNYLDQSAIDDVENLLDIGTDPSEILSKHSIEYDENIEWIHEKDKNIVTFLRLLTYSRKYIASERTEERMFVGKTKNSFIINNTYLFILRKDIEGDKNIDSLLTRISDELVEGRNSFIQLLGLEMQTIFNRNESFVNEKLLESSSEAFFTHRNFLKEKNKTDAPFNSLIKSLLIEHASLRLRTSKLSLLDSSFLDIESQKYSAIPTESEIASMNTFYNSVNVKSLNSIDFPYVNFGDIFVDKKGLYYLCITALCDCLRPLKINQNYFFVVGEDLDIESANVLGDSAFISYIPGNKAISWINYESTKKIKTKKIDDVSIPDKLVSNLESAISDKSMLNNIKDYISKGLNVKEARINSLNAEIDAIKKFKYKPVYIQPHTFNIKNPKIQDDKIELRRVESNKPIPEVADNGNLNIFNVKYVTTLRPNYTQRIANHTFAHSVRVGVDFVSK